MLKNFGIDPNDLPLNVISSAIERNFLHMTRQKPLPPIHINPIVILI
ncbi:TPA: hypothetical protein ACTW1K_000506 [Raoultella planticola]